MSKIKECYICGDEFKAEFESSEAICEDCTNDLYEDEHEDD